MTTKPLPEPAPGARAGAAHEATIELLCDPEAMVRVRRAEADISSGQVTTAEEMAALMAQRAARERSA